MGKNKVQKLALRPETSMANVGNQIAITSKILKSISVADVLPHKPIENLLIEETSISARIDFRGNGELWISGRMLDLDSELFFIPIFHWVERYLLNPANSTNLNIDLEYINTGSLKNLFNYLIKTFGNHNEQKFRVQWYCDKEDEDLIESIKIISALSRCDVSLILK